MSNRWKVVRWEVPFPEPHWGWEVIEDLGTVEEFHGPFTTHVEAMAYADHMARIPLATPEPDHTIKRPTKHPDRRGPLRGAPEQHGGGYILHRPHKKKHQALHLERADLIPVALTLLALARKDT